MAWHDQDAFWETLEPFLFARTRVADTAAEVERAAATAAGLPLQVVEGDMRTFCRPGAFDAVLSLANSFGYFEEAADDHRTLVAACRSLRPSGAFLLGGLLTKEVLARTFPVLPSRYREEVDGAVVLQETDVTGDGSRMENHRVVLRGGSRTELAFTQRLYAAPARV